MEIWYTTFRVRLNFLTLISVDCNKSEIKLYFVVIINNFSDVMRYVL